MRPTTWPVTAASICRLAWDRRALSVLLGVLQRPSRLTTLPDSDQDQTVVILNRLDLHQRAGVSFPDRR